MGVSILSEPFCIIYDYIIILLTAIIQYKIYKVYNIIIHIIKYDKFCQ